MAKPSTRLQPTGQAMPKASSSACQRWMRASVIAAIPVSQWSTLNLSTMGRSSHKKGTATLGRHVLREIIGHADGSGPRRHAGSPLK